MDPKQADQIKAQLIEQLKSSPNKNKKQIEEAIKAMSNSQLEEFLKQNKIQYKTEGKGEECVFCSILDGKIPAYILDENKKSLAILEINPLSKGHLIVISKEHKKLPTSAFSLANKLAKRLKSKLKAEEVKIENAKILGHELINVIPLYKDTKLEPKKASQKELILLQEKLKTKPRKKATKKAKNTKSLKVKELEKAPIRIP